MRPSPRRTGFTLIELMAALVAGLIAISAIYAVSSGSARHFHEQQRIAQTQMSLRMAMAQLRSDIQRAGLNGTPNSQLANPPNLRGCPQPNPRIQAVEFRNNVYGPDFPEAALNEVEFDQLRFVGNYSTTSSYFVATATNPNQVRLQATWQGFRRDFSQVDEAGNATPSEDALAAAFAPGRMLHIRTLQDTSVFTPIVDTMVTGGLIPDVRINVGIPMPITSPCMPGLGDAASAAPLSRIEYAVVNPRDTPELAGIVSTMNPQVEATLGMSPAVLVRREIDFNCDANCPVIPGSTRVVLEYVAEFDIRLVVDQQLLPSEPPTFAILDGALAEAQVALNNPGSLPQSVRSVIVRLSARTPGTQPQFPAQPRDNPNDPLTNFQVGGNAPGAARVRTIEAEIFLPNLVPNPM